MFSNDPLARIGDLYARVARVFPEHPLLDQFNPEHPEQNIPVLRRTYGALWYVKYAAALHNAYVTTINPDRVVSESDLERVINLK